MAEIYIDFWLKTIAGNVGICLDFGDGRILRHNSEERFPAASLIKLPIFLCYRRACEESSICSDQRIVLQAKDMVGGCGRLQHEAPGRQYPLGTIAEWMLTLSDNTATNILIDILGLDKINSLIQRLGLSATTLERKLMDTVARVQGRDNWTRPEDMLRLFQLLKAPPAHLASAAAATLTVLKNQAINHKLPKDLPADTVVAHKTGELDDTEHDAGIIFRQGASAIAVVMTTGLADASQGVALCRRVGAWVYAQMVDIQEHG